MTESPPGTPGHGNGTPSLRLQPKSIENGYIKGGYTDMWELICPACGDSYSLDYSSVTPEIQKIRGPYSTIDEAKGALRAHCGLFP